MSDFQRRIEGQIPALRRYARGLLRDSDQAEDLLQDCLERALSRRHLFVRHGNLRAWLFRIMRHIYLNDLRALRRAGPTLELEEDSLPSGSADQITHVEAAETLAAFERLSVEHREVLLMVVVEGLGYREAAKILGVPAGTVMSRAARAREELRLLCRMGSKAHLRRVK
jgi:RNA polymerase sigma-70 factor (ECF subfamily)